ncbi:class I SAM-dependent methyltransferase [Nocardia terpenica]|uniref:class I SAM-dependent methyltransferase n=1 Tax=Nocardia terpenica TaxID=455432 RepID=UPI0009EEB64A|nr:class I SAM-dependent methyltransferase [Nocardia terpenica]NQE91219.1 methyltransferase domain-containing protein [Nocardia terpenica]
MAKSANETRPRYGQQLFAANAREARRLDMLESVCDPVTMSVLANLNIRSDLLCLEVGAGRGVIARKMADLVPDGGVIATDLAIGQLKSHQSNLQALRHDVAVDDFPEASFDLIHARFMLDYLPARESVLTRMVGWLKPGGVIVIEGFDWERVGGSDYAYTATMAAHDILSETTRGFDPSWSQRTPEALADNGLQRIETRIHRQTTTVRGGTLTAALWRLTLAQTRISAVNAGLATDNQFTKALRSLSDPSFVETGPTMISSWGFRTRKQMPQRRRNDLS